MIKSLRGIIRELGAKEFKKLAYKCDNRIDLNESVNNACYILESWGTSKKAIRIYNQIRLSTKDYSKI